MDSLLIRTDYQAIVKSLKSNLTTNNTFKDLKNALNECSTKTKIRVKRIKAHIGIEGNERANELAKFGTSIVPISPSPHTYLPKTYIHNQIDNQIRTLWDTRWQMRTPAKLGSSSRK